MKKALCLLVVLLAITTFILPFNVSAKTYTEEVDGFSAEIATNGDDYETGEPIDLTVTVSNGNKADAQNIKVELFLPEGLACARGSVASSRLDIKAGADTAFTATLNVAKGTESFSTANVDRSDATDARKVPIISIVIAIALGVGILVAVFFIIIKPQKRVRILCIVLSAVLLLGYIPLGIFTFADRDVVLYVDKSVVINGEKAKVIAKVTKYQDAHSQRVDVNMGDALYDTKQDLYHTKTDLRTLTGWLFNPDYVESATITVKDEIDNVLLERSFTPEKEFKIEKFGLVVGINRVEFTITHKDGFLYREKFQINNLQEANMDNITVDKGDNDADGVLNYIEKTKGTDPEKEDTDDDRLSDYMEIAVLGTDPLKEDTDGNQVSDADEDADFDELSNVEEIETHKTNPASPDTDLDGLDDKEELAETLTNPVEADTDNDGKNDKWELDKDYDPLIFNAEFPKTEAESEVEEIKIEADGDASVKEVVGDLNLNEDIPGAIGVPPFEVELESGSEATIYIDYDPEALGEEKPVLYEYEEETQNFKEVENAVVGENSVQFSTTKSGKYILLNYRYMEDVWENDFLRPSEYDPDANIDIVFVIDRSASMDQNDPNGYRKEATVKFVEKLREEKDRAGVVQFTAIGETVIPLTSDKQAVCEAVNGITNSDGGGCGGTDQNAGTNGSAGLRQAFNLLEGSTATYKFIIFLTDGGDTSVSESYGDSQGLTGLTGEARRKGIVIHTVGLIGYGEVDTDLLKTVAAGAKGNYYKLTVSEDAAELEDNFIEVFDELESVTIDRQTDANNDGISDYYTKLIVEGKLASSGGNKYLFGTATYEEVQASADLDGDGLLNGQELEITENEKGVFVKLNAYPYLADSDKDGMGDEKELGTVLSAMKFNAHAFAPELEWLTNDANFESFAYMDFYEESDGAQTAVFVGNVFFGSNINMTAVYRQKLVDMFAKVDEQVSQLYKDENYQALVKEYYEGTLDVMSEELHRYFEAEDETSFTEALKSLYGFAKDTMDFHKGAFKVDIPETLAKSIMTSKEIKPLDDEILRLKWLIKDADTHVGGTPEAVSGYIAKAQKHLGQLETLKGDKLSDIAVKAQGFAKVFGQVVFLIDAGVTIYDNYINYTEAVAVVETVMDNVYILDCISNTEDPFLNLAAYSLKKAFDAAAQGNMEILKNLAIQDATLSIAAEAIHQVIGQAGWVGKLVEIVRVFGNLVLDASDNAQQAINVVTAANVGKALSYHLNAHIEGGDAVRMGDEWRAYSGYSKTFLNCIMNLAVVRIDAEETYAQWDCLKVSKEKEANANANAEKARTLLMQYHMQYTYYLSIE